MAAYTQRYVWQTGKNLFDILNQLPNFGVGRIVTLGRWQHFTPDKPSYYKITRVKVDCTKENLNYGEVWGQPTKEGYSCEGLEVKIPSWWLREWKLVRKSEETEFCAYTPQADDFQQVPKYVRMPPLLEELVHRERTARGEEASKPLTLDKSAFHSHASRFYFADGDESISDYGREDVNIDRIGDLTETIKLLDDFRKPVKNWDWEDIWAGMNAEEN